MHRVARKSLAALVIMCFANASAMTLTNFAFWVCNFSYSKLGWARMSSSEHYIVIAELPGFSESSQLQRTHNWALEVYHTQLDNCWRLHQRKYLTIIHPFNVAIRRITSCFCAPRSPPPLPAEFVRQTSTQIERCCCSSVEFHSYSSVTDWS